MGLLMWIVELCLPNEVETESIVNREEYFNDFDGCVQWRRVELGGYKCRS